MWPRRRSRIATSATASCPTRPSTWSTRPRLRWRSRSAPCRRRSTSSSARRPRSRSSAQALKRETDRELAERLEEVERELAELREQATACARAGRRSAKPSADIAELKKKLEALRFEAEEQTRKGKLERAAQIQYGELPKLEAELKQLTASRMAARREGCAGRAAPHAEGRGRRGGHRQDRQQVDRHSRLEDARRRGEEAGRRWKTGCASASSARMRR